MVIACCVPQCETKGTSGFHNFPSNKDLRVRWMNAVRVFHFSEQELLNSFRKVCRRHFRDTDYQTHANGAVRLKYNTVPSQHLPNPIWMEHNYVVSWRSDATKKKFKPAKSQKKVSNPIGKQPSVQNAYVDYDSGTVKQLAEPAASTSINKSRQTNKENPREEEVRTLQVTVLELKKLLMAKDKLLAAQNRTITIKNKQLWELRRKLRSTRQTKRNVSKCIDEVFSDNKEIQMFFQMQAKNVNKSKNAHRFTSEQKSFCLTLYKQSPKMYRNSLRKFFVLPSKRTLGRHSAQLSFESGVNVKFFNYLEQTVAKMNEIDRHCILVWDEMALKPHLDYNEARDVIDGFVEMIEMRRPSFATHALVFMVRGINKNFKEPVAYFYTDGLKSFELREMIICMGTALLPTGLKIIGSVCDQANAAAINELVASNPEGNSRPNKGDLLTYKLGNNTVIHFYDPPHLLKGTRNNLLTKNLKHAISGRWSRSYKKAISSKKKRQTVASWDDVAAVYEHVSKGSGRLLPKITPEHISPNRSKMRVSVASQIFSETYGRTMMQCSNEIKPLKDRSGTAEVLYFFNDIFDSLNTSTATTTNELKSPVQEGSIHFRYWDYALQELSDMKFIDKKSGAATHRTKNIENWQSTIKGYAELSKKCIKLGMSKIALRY